MTQAKKWAAYAKERPDEPQRRRDCVYFQFRNSRLYNFYRIAENVGALHKYYYMVRYSMLKTLAGKHRTNVSVIKKRHMVNGVLRIPYDTTKGRKYCEFYHDGFRKHSDGYDNVADVMPSYRKYDSRHTIVNP